jgi:hypothetical protein
MSARLSKLAELACIQARGGVLRRIASGVRVGNYNSSGVGSTRIHSRMVEMIGLNFRDSFVEVNL